MTIRNAEVSTHLSIKNCSRLHNGIYTLTATNEAGDMQQDITVLVQGI